jgi:predicted neuraminidase
MTHDNIHEDSLQPPPVLLHPGPQYGSAQRKWQGIPGIEKTARGRLYATWYSGGDKEGPANYVLLAHSDNDGEDWSAPGLVIDPPGDIRAYDPVLWMDPQGRLWLFWAQCHTWWNGRGGVWCIRCDEPDADEPAWSQPRRIANGVMMNKPLVLRNGDWLLPVAVWAAIPPVLPELKREALSSVLHSGDEGRTFAWQGGADIPHRHFDEHMVVERRDGSLWMLVRTRYGIGQSTSLDGGRTWSAGLPTDIGSPDTRFHVRRLPSGRLLFVGHYGFTERSHLTAMLSEDDGHTWPHRLLLDEREKVSYPDATCSEDGVIHAIYDRDRHGAREILMARFEEQDILAGNLISGGGYLRRLVDHPGAVPAEPVLEH